MSTSALYLAQTLPDLHEGDADEIAVVAPDFQGWMVTVILVAIVLTLFSRFLIRRKLPGDWNPMMNVWVGIGMFIAILQVVVIYCGFSRNIFPPVILLCVIALRLMCKGNPLPRRRAIPTASSSCSTDSRPTIRISPAWPKKVDEE